MSEDTIRTDNGATPSGSGSVPSGGEPSEIELQVRRIQDKLQQLVRQRDALLKENGKLKEDLYKLQHNQGGDNKRLEQLQQQVEILKVTKSTTAMNEGEKRDLEKRLGQYIREIDRCIMLLGQ